MPSADGGRLRFAVAIASVGDVANAVMLMRLVVLLMQSCSDETSCTLIYYILTIQHFTILLLQNCFSSVHFSVTCTGYPAFPRRVVAFVLCVCFSTRPPYMLGSTVYMYIHFTFDFFSV